MSAYLSVGLTVTEETDPESVVEAHCQGYEDGHIAAVMFGDVKVQTSGDGTRNLLALLDVARRKVEVAHREWLAASAAGLFDRLDENLRNGEPTPDALRHAAGVDTHGEVPA